MIKIGFIGLGLIGGSLAKTIRYKHPDSYICALDTNTQALEKAAEDGVLNRGYTTLTDDFKDCDYIVLAALPSVNISYLSILKSYVSNKTIITDVSSVKTPIHHEVETLKDIKFIGGHPMAGSEKSGYQHSTNHLFENVYYIITPSAFVSQEEIQRYTYFISTLGSLPLVLTYQEHDYITAAVSHVPHVIAYSLVNLVKNSDSKEEYMKMIAAGGFRDITRIASSDPKMWEDIVLENKDNTTRLLKDYVASLNQTITNIESSDTEALVSSFGSAQAYRESMDTAPKGEIKVIYDLYCDLVDEAGAIATIATILSTHAISIKNIGIIHNRTFQDGALRIEFYDEDALKKAQKVLPEFHYTIFERR